MLGFETIGSATIVAYDEVPVLTTDAWINGDAYFGSWTHDYEIPAAQMDAIKRAKYHWFSHGHPDHLNIDSLPSLTQGKFLLSDHHGSRIHRELTAAGHEVQVLRDRVWVPLSRRIKVMSFANQNQDSVLLIDINGRLVIDANDSPDFGASWHIKRIARQYRHVYMCQLHGWGGADMMNLFGPDGAPLTVVETKRRSIAPRAQRSAMQHGANKVIPFSSFHRYQREDSAWANALVPELHDYQADAHPTGPEMLPAFVHVDCDTDEITPLNPPRTALELKKPEAFNDSWSDRLTDEDIPLLNQYFRQREHLSDHFGFVELSAGGRSHVVDLNPALKDVGIRFECPRHSLMTSIQYEIFDDLLIGNYMKTTLFKVEGLYPDFSPFVAKYADNGGAKSKRELSRYFHHYVMRDPVGVAMSRFATASEQVIRSFAGENTLAFRMAKRVYYSLGARR
ncbi:MAG: MBL fold metallo-hydrolase [Comamonadaceae bacterium]|nr:MAG: MBL fold metallo-hydrolase [Comamonadaceae bacterium]